MVTLSNNTGVTNDFWQETLSVLYKVEGEEGGAKLAMQEVLKVMVYSLQHTVLSLNLHQDTVEWRCTAVLQALLQNPFCIYFPFCSSCAGYRAFCLAHLVNTLVLRWCPHCLFTSESRWFPWPINPKGDYWTVNLSGKPPAIANTHFVGIHLCALAELNLVTACAFTFLAGLCEVDPKVS